MFFPASEWGALLWSLLSRSVSAQLPCVADTGGFAKAGFSLRELDGQPVLEGLTFVCSVSDIVGVLWFSRVPRVLCGSVCVGRRWWAALGLTRAWPPSKPPRCFHSSRLVSVLQVLVQGQPGP